MTNKQRAESVMGYIRDYKKESKLPEETPLEFVITDIISCLLHAGEEKDIDPERVLVHARMHHLATSFPTQKSWEDQKKAE
jgi:hypothetical protein